MKGQIKEPSGVLVVHAWIEGAAMRGLRARITQISDLGEEQTETSAATVDEILTAVRAWLEGLLAEAETPH